MRKSLRGKEGREGGEDNRRKGEGGEEWGRKEEGVGV